MKFKPQIEAQITVLPSEEGKRRSSLHIEMLGYVECSLVVESGTWDCRLVFPNNNDSIEPGQTATAHVRVLNSTEALRSLSLGDTFQLLKEKEFIATGRVTNFLVAPIKQELKLEFTGTGKEYFRIWIVNLFLTLITFGIFSAWAKVRKKLYFYSHTILDGTPFQYLGQPLPILKGRIRAK
jgi:hypothetical protein